MSKSPKDASVSSHSEVVPPFQSGDEGEMNRVARVRDLLSAMGARAKPHVIYTTLPACNSDC